MEKDNHLFVRGGCMKKGFDPKYDDNKKEDVIYVGKENKRDETKGRYRSMEIISSQEDSMLTEKNKDANSSPVDFNILSKETLYVTNGGQIKVFCWLLEDGERRGITALHISRRTSKGVYGTQEVTLNAKSITMLKKFLDNIHVIDTTNKQSFKLPISELQDDKNGAIITDAEFIELIKANVKSTDDFYKLISIQKMEQGIDRLVKIIDGDYSHETEIQKFLKEHLWMFGNDYAFVAENGVINSENILDLMPKNIESYVDIIEVKLPKETLFNYDDSHNNYYPTSKLTKAISQTQNYIFELEKRTIDEVYQREGDFRVVRPKGIIIFGSGNPLGEGEAQYLRILNSSYHNLHILTYQQLLDKANMTINFFKNI